jgi:hypothetical protein
MTDKCSHDHPTHFPTSQKCLSDPDLKLLSNPLCIVANGIQKCKSSIHYTKIFGVACNMCMCVHSCIKLLRNVCVCEVRNLVEIEILIFSEITKATFSKVWSFAFPASVKILQRRKFFLSFMWLHNTRQQNLSFITNLL